MSDKPFKCKQCGKCFTTHKGMQQHRQAAHFRVKHKQPRGSRKSSYAGVSKADRIDVLDSLYGDLTDGAYFAMAQSEFGLKPEDFIKEQAE